MTDKIPLLEGTTPGPWEAALTGKPEHNNEEWLVFAADENENGESPLVCVVNTQGGQTPV